MSRYDVKQNDVLKASFWHLLDISSPSVARDSDARVQKKCCEALVVALPADFH